MTTAGDHKFSHKLSVCFCSFCHSNSDCRCSVSSSSKECLTVAQTSDALQWWIDPLQPFPVWAAWKSAVAGASKIKILEKACRFCCCCCFTSAPDPTRFLTSCVRVCCVCAQLDVGPVLNGVEGMLSDGCSDRHLLPVDHLHRRGCWHRARRHYQAWRWDGGGEQPAGGRASHDIC